jgi:hypothetical protein
VPTLWARSWSGGDRQIKIGGRIGPSRVSGTGKLERGQFPLSNREAVTWIDPPINIKFRHCRATCKPVRGAEREDRDLADGDRRLGLGARGADGETQARLVSLIRTGHRGTVVARFDQTSEFRLAVRCVLVVDGVTIPLRDSSTKLGG